MNRYYGYQGAKFIRQTRQKLGLSTAELAVLLTVSEDAVFKWESGEVCPTFEHMSALCGLKRPERVKKPVIKERRRNHVGWQNELLLQWNPRLRRRSTDWRHELEYRWKQAK